MTASAVIQNIERRALAADPPVQLLTVLLESPFEFAAGQYLSVMHPDGTSIPLSIASPPERLPELQLHYRSTPGLVEATRMDELLRSGQLALEGGAGEVTLRPDDDRPLLLVAGGTGISQALCLALAQSTRHPATPVQLLACADADEDFYFRDMLPNGSKFAAELIADANRDGSNAGLRWLTSNATGLSADTRVVISGSPGFVYAATDTLTSVGVSEARLESDVYAWAPR